MSVLAGAFSAYGSLAVMLAIVALVAVGINGGRDFGTMRGAEFRNLTVLAVVLSSFVAFVFGGYTAGRMSRRSGVTNGVLAGIVGAIIGVAGVAVARSAHAGVSLHRVAIGMHVPSSWADWRAAVIWGAVVTAAAIVLGGLLGGSSGERWHTKLLARAADSSYGPEAERLAAAQRQAAEAAAAHTAAQQRVARASAVSDLPGRPTITEPAATGRSAKAERAGAAEPGYAELTPTKTERAVAAHDAEASRAPEADRAGADAGALKRNRRHLLHR